MSRSPRTTDQESINGVVVASLCTGDRIQVLITPPQNRLDRFAQGLAERGYPVLDSNRTVAHHDAFHDPAALQSPQSGGQRLLRDGHQATQLVEPTRLLAQLLEDEDGPLVEDLAQNLAVLWAEDESSGGFTHDT